MVYSKVLRIMKKTIFRKLKGPILIDLKIYDKVMVTMTLYYKNRQIIQQHIKREPRHIRIGTRTGCEINLTQHNIWEKLVFSINGTGAIGNLCRRIVTITSHHIQKSIWGKL